MYSIGMRQDLKVKFIGRDEYKAKIYIDNFGNKIFWFTNSNKLEDNSFVTISAEIYSCVNGDKIEYYRIFNPKKKKGD